MKKRITALLLAVMLIAVMAIPVSASSFNTEVRNSIAPIAVHVNMNGSGSLYSYGTCFFIGATDEDPQYVVTNHHVVDTFLELGAGNTLTMSQTSEDGSEVATGSMKVTMRVYFDANDYVEAYEVASDAKKDIAIFKLEKPTTKRKALALNIPTDEMIGAAVYAVGFPSISDNSLLDPVSQWGKEDATVTTGAISRLATQSGTGVKQVMIDANISGGNSGGPLVDGNGYVVGVNTWSAIRNDGVEANYAVNIEEVIDLCDRNNIPYELAGSDSSLMWIIIGVVAVLVIALIAVLLLRKTPAPATRQTPISSPAPVIPTVDNSAELRFQSTSGVFAGKRFSIDGTVRIGRDPSRNDLVFPNGTQGISGVHCILIAKDGVLYLQDLGSTYGTFVNGGQRLAPNQPVVLRAGDRFSLGSDRESFVITPRGGL